MTDNSHEISTQVTPTPEGFRQSRFRAPAAATTLLLVRHGESAAAVPGAPFPLVGGHGDPELHQAGRAQALMLKDRLRREHENGAGIDAIYVTNLRRTAETAAPFAESSGFTPAVVADLREVHLGEWEGGEFRSRVAAGDPIVARIFTEQRWDVIPGAESLGVFDRRLRRGIDTIVGQHAGGRVMVVVHGGVIGHLLHIATGSSPFAFAGADNASISEIVVHGERWYLRRFNDTAHLVDG